MGPGCVFLCMECGLVGPIYMCVPRWSMDLWVLHVCSYVDCGLVDPACCSYVERGLVGPIRFLRGMWIMI